MKPFIEVWYHQWDPHSPVTDYVMGWFRNTFEHNQRLQQIVEDHPEWIIYFAVRYPENTDLNEVERVLAP